MDKSYEKWSLKYTLFVMSPYCANYKDFAFHRSSSMQLEMSPSSISVSTLTENINTVKSDSGVTCGKTNGNNSQRYLVH